MIEYVLCFLLSIFFTFKAEKNFKDKNNKTAICFSIIAILIPSILSGARALTIGVDVKVYVEPTFQRSLYVNSIFEFLQIFDLEPLYLVLTYVVAKITNNIHWLLFIIQLIIVTLIYMASYKNQKYSPMWLSMCVYFLTFYNTTYNLTRQALAVAFIIFSISYMREKKYLRTLIIFCIAMMFHTTAIFAGLIYVFIFIEQNKTDNKFKNIILILIHLILLICVLFYQEIIYFLTYVIDFLPEKYYEFFDDPNYALKKANINFLVLFFRVFWITLFVFQKKNKRDFGQKDLLHIMITDMMLVTVSFKIINAYRMTYYYWCTGMILGVPSLLKVFKQNKNNINLATFGIVSVLVIYWYINFIYLKYDATYPFLWGI